MEIGRVKKEADELETMRQTNLVMTWVGCLGTRRRENGKCEQEEPRYRSPAAPGDDHHLRYANAAVASDSAARAAAGFTTAMVTVKFTVDVGAARDERSEL